MLSFSTEFPVPDTVTTDQVSSAVREWILGSRYTRFTAETLKGLGQSEVWDAAEETEFIETIREDTDDISTIAIIYRRDEQDFDWISTIVFAAQPSSNWISVRVECEPRHPRAKVPAAKKPVLIKTLLEKFGGGIDGDFKMASAPVHLMPSELDIAARCVTGQADSYLPILYISAHFNGHYHVDPNNLATMLYGMAHVVVEPSRQFSVDLMTMVDRKNVYGGTIGLYWPEDGGRRCFFRQDNNQPEDLERAIFEEIRHSLINRRPLLRCTLGAVKELRSRRQINALKDAGSKTVDAYISAFEEENKSKSTALAEAEAEITRLKAELRHLDVQNARTDGIYIDTGGECDFYEGELLDIVREAINSHVQQVVPDSRRQHVLYSLTCANPVSSERAKLRERVKSLLRDYQNMDGRTKREFEQMGFTIGDSGKHYKLVYQGDGRYTFSLPKSGSDFRGGMNAASDICKQLF